MPRAIREALLPEETGQFDSEWRMAMSRSAECLDLAEVYTVLERWRGIAALTQADPEAHRRMLRHADLILTGQDRGTVTADDMREMLARRLGQRPDTRSSPTTRWHGRSAHFLMSDGAMRKLLFGPGGRAEIIYLVLEHDRRVELLRLHWVS